MLKKSVKDISKSSKEKKIKKDKNVIGFFKSSEKTEDIKEPEDKLEYLEEEPERKRTRDVGVDLVRLYFDDIKNIPLLTPEEEVELSKKIKKGDEEARSRMIRSNLRLVITIAKKYSRYNLSMLDIIEEGNIGLMQAVKKFDHRKGYRFSTYASWWIKQAIIRSFSMQGKTIRIPVYMTEIISKWRKTINNLRQSFGRNPTDEEVAKKMQLKIEKVRMLKEITRNILSLDEKLDDEMGTLINVIEDVSGESTIDTVTQVLQRERIEDLFCKNLDEREVDLFKLRYGLTEDRTPHTLEEIGKKMGITRERVRQLEERAMKKLKQGAQEELQELDL
jgi:RNA polymerase primary sigma factor